MFLQRILPTGPFTLALIGVLLMLPLTPQAQRGYERPVVIERMQAYKQLIGADPDQKLIELQTLNKELVYDIRYATSNNFTGQALYPRTTTLCFLRRPAAEALSRVANSLQKKGLGLKIFDATESLLAHAVFAVPAIRGIEFGTGFAAAKMFGSAHNDAIEDSEGATRTNHAGGIVGGLTNGNELVFRVAVKPTSSTPKEQRSLNTSSGRQEEFVIKGRHDLCIALRVPVVIEAVTAIVLADLLMREQRIGRVLS